MVMAPVESMVACRLLAASAALRSLSVETWPAAVPKVMLVATPLPVAAMDSVLLVSALSACVTPVPNPSAASAPALLLVMLRLLAVPVCNVILPLASIEAAFAPVEPVIWSMAVSTSCTVPVVLMVPPVALVLVALALLKVRVLPSTVRVSPSANPVARAWLLGVDAPESAVVVLRTDAAAGTAILVTLGVVRPSAVSAVLSALPPSVMAVVLLVVRLISPVALIALVPPVMLSIASRTVWTDAVPPALVPIVMLPVVASVAVAVVVVLSNLMVLPLTVMVSPLAIAVLSADAPPAGPGPVSRVAPVIAGAGETAVPPLRVTVAMPRCGGCATDRDIASGAGYSTILPVASREAVAPGPAAVCNAERMPPTVEVER